MNPLIFKLCRKCNTPYKHFGSSLTKCPRCEELKNELKGNAKQEKNARNMGEQFQSRKAVVVRSKIKSERAGKNLRKLTSEPTNECAETGKTDSEHFRKGLGEKRTYSIPKISDKKKKAKALIALLKGERIAEIGKKCECCDLPGEVDYSHNIPISLREDLETVKGAGHLACRNDHRYWEHLQHPKEVLKFKNLDWLLNFLKENDTGRYMHVCDLLKIEYDLEQLNYIR